MWASIVDPETGEPILHSNEMLDETGIEKLIKSRHRWFEILFIDGTTTSDSIHKTLLLDKVETKEEALIEIYRRLRPGNPATPEVAQDFMDHLFFNQHITIFPVSGG